MRISNFINLWEKYEQAGDDGLPIVLKESQMEQWQIYRTRWRDLIASAASILNGIATKFTMGIHRC